MINTGLGIISFPISLTLAYSGYSLLGYGLLGDLFGTIVIISGAAIEGPLIINGRRIDINFSNLKIYQAKGINLKKTFDALIS